MPGIPRIHPGAPAMQLLCPHCRNPLELSTLPVKDDVVCPSCGSSFHLEGGSTTAYAPRTDRVGKFQLLERVGQGTFGTVYKARDPELDRVVAVKVPRAGNVPGEHELDRFLREARSVAQLRHPAIVPGHEVGQADGVPYLVCEFVHGVTLADRLTDRAPSFRESAQMVAAIADALQYAHEHGVVHRDVKPSNVLIDNRPLVARSHRVESKFPFRQIHRSAFGRHAAPADHTPLFSLRENAIGREPGLRYAERWRCVS